MKSIMSDESSLFRHSFCLILGFFCCRSNFRFRCSWCWVISKTEVIVGQPFQLHQTFKSSSSLTHPRVDVELASFEVSKHQESVFRKSWTPVYARLEAIFQRLKNTKVLVFKGCYISYKGIVYFLPFSPWWYSCRNRKTWHRKWWGWWVLRWSNQERLPRHWNK